MRHRSVTEYSESPQVVLETSAVTASSLTSRTLEKNTLNRKCKRKGNMRALLLLACVLVVGGTVGKWNTKVSADNRNMCTDCSELEQNVHRLQ